MNEQIPQGTVSGQTVVGAHPMRFGADLTAAGTRFRLWAPYCGSIDLAIEGETGTRPMLPLPDGWFELEVAGAGAGIRYRFVLPDGSGVPDPAARFMPDNTSGPSEVVDPGAYRWHDAVWQGRPWEEAIIYEVHVGAFTPEGTFRAAIDRLPHLVDLGVTAIELMPLAGFPGAYNWGYDGVALYAPDATYGRPEDLKALVDAAHAAGLMIFLDVVYNHFGPVGNHMQAHAPLLSQHHDGEFGKPPNVDAAGSAVVRDFLISNALYWLAEYHFDGLRVDAAQEIADDGPRHFLAELAERVQHLDPRRKIHLVAENSGNQAGWLRRRPDGSPAFYTAHWDDDLHHSLHRVLTGERYWYYGDYDDALAHLGRALAEGYSYQGEALPSGSSRGEPSAFLPPTAFVIYLQNHDQVGNRPRAERITTTASVASVRAAAALCLLSPHVPLLFMGEEWAAGAPFPYFADFSGALAEEVRRSRREQLCDWPEIRENQPLPAFNARTTFEAARLRWDEREATPHAQQLALYRSLIEARKAEIVPRLAGIGGHAGRYRVIEGQGLEVCWQLGDGMELRLLANLAATPLRGVVPGDGRRLWLEGGLDAAGLAPWTVVWSLVGE